MLQTTQGHTFSYQTARSRAPTPPRSAPTSCRPPRSALARRECYMPRLKTSSAGHAREHGWRRRSADEERPRHLQLLACRHQADHVRIAQSAAVEQCTFQQPGVLYTLLRKALGPQELIEGALEHGRQVVYLRGHHCLGRMWRAYRRELVQVARPQALEP